MFCPAACYQKDKKTNTGKNVALQSSFFFSTKFNTGWEGMLPVL